MRQQLDTRNTYTPTDVVLVGSNCDLSSNRDQSLSVASLKTVSNNPEGHLPQYTEGLKAVKVYVVSKEGTPLMPCSPCKAKNLLKQGKARVVKRYPFTIRLNFDCENQTQPITCGGDLGYANIGYSCITKKEELISGEIILENGMTKRLLEKAMYRRGRRNRHHWYRKPRFDNPGDLKGWFPPSVKRRLDTHVMLVKKLMQLLPITQVNIEVANFDIQKINNPEINGTGYQQGSLYDYENVKTYILAREHGKCQLCGKEYGGSGNGWHLHHITSKSKAGTDKPSNLALLHDICHDKLHKKGLQSKLKKAKQFKAETFMSTIRWKIVEEVKKLCDSVTITFGYKTKIKRHEQNMEKSHHNDAFVIANGNGQARSATYGIIRKRCHNRCLQINRKGYKPSIRKVKYKIQPRDLIWIKGKQYISKGTGSLGRYVYVEPDKSDTNIMKGGYVRAKDIEKHFSMNSWNFMLQSANGSSILPACTFRKAIF